MKIKTVEGFHLVAPLSKPAGNANGFMGARQALLIRITTACGLSGWGEAGPAPDGTSAWLQRVAAPKLIGRNPLQINKVWHELMAMRGYDRQGTAMMAISAIDIALHDIASQANGMSVAALLGGALRHAHLAYASGPYLVQGDDPYSGFLDQMASFVDEGFRALKPRGGGSNTRTAEFLLQCRHEFGTNIALMIDLNGGYSAADTLDLLNRIEDLQIGWIEEPVSLEDLPGNARVSRMSRIPLATGESLATLQDFKTLLDQVELSVLQPDLTVCGGYTGMRQIAALAGAQNVAVVPHIWGSCVGFLAALQMIATLPGSTNRAAEHYPWIELDRGENPLMNLLGEITPDRDGYLAYSDEAGLAGDLTPERFKPWLDNAWSV